MFNAPINAELIKFVQSFSNPVLDNFFIAVTMLGGEFFFTAAILIIFWCIDKGFGYRIAFVFLSSCIVNLGLKETLKVDRPIGEAGIRSLAVETAEGYSFPSGHSQNVASFWIPIMLYAKNFKAYTAGIIIIVLVALSRIYLGVHRPVDVAAGIIIGLVWVFAANFLFDISEKTGAKSILLIILVPMMLLMYFIPTDLYFKTAGMVLGFYLGYIVEPRYIDFQVKSSIQNQVLKAAIGLSVFFIIRTLVKLVLPVSLGSDFFRYFIIAIWSTIGAPYIFKRYFTNKSNTIST